MSRGVARSRTSRRAGAEYFPRLADADSSHDISLAAILAGEVLSPDATVEKMKMHPGFKPAVWGAVVGAVAITIVGFSTLGWTLGSTAEQMATNRADMAVVAALMPVCVAKFEAESGATAKLVEFKKVSSWDQSSFIEKGGWATMPGSDKPNSAVARACAEKLGNST
jgi:hypothetical protein